MSLCEWHEDESFMKPRELRSTVRPGACWLFKCWLMSLRGGGSLGAHPSRPDTLWVLPLSRHGPLPTQPPRHWARGDHGCDL